MGNEIRGYKVFNPDWTCRGFQYEVGKIFEENAEPIACERGFHFCLKLEDCFNYYTFNPENKVAEVVALGAVDADEDFGSSKCCTNKIQIIREIPWQKVLELVNIGKSCTGLCNTGNRNTGNRNTGDCNTTSFSSGCFNTEEQKIYLFNKPSDWTYRDWINSNAKYLLNQIPRYVVEWIHSSDMTDDEKEAHPEYETTGGYLKVLDEADCSQIWWDNLPEYHRQIIREIPNFDASIFSEITGIKIS